MGELVPDTPRGTAEPYHALPPDAPPATQLLDSHGQSYLLDLLQGDSTTQDPSALLRQTAPSAGRPPIASAAADNDDDVDQLADEDSVPDSQQLSPPDDDGDPLQESLPVATPAGGRPLLRSQSALVLGPDDPSGYSDGEPAVGDLGETQAAHSLDDDDSWRSRGGSGGGGGERRARRSSGARESSRTSVSVGGRAHDGDGEDDVSMDLTTAAGRVLPSHDDVAADGDDGPHAPRASDSQKENPMPSLPSARSQGHPPFSLSVQSNVDDASGAPSSSPAVAQHLLASRRPPPPRKLSPGGGGGLDKLQSSADKAGGAPSSASGRAGSSSSHVWDRSMSMSGPEVRPTSLLPSSTFAPDSTLTFPRRPRRPPLPTSHLPRLPSPSPAPSRPSPSPPPTRSTPPSPARAPSLSPLLAAPRPPPPSTRTSLPRRRP